jgi:hypothetical protein
MFFFQDIRSIFSRIQIIYLIGRLSLEMTQAVLMTRYYLKIDAINCVNFKPTEEMLKKFNVRMYDFKDIDHSVDDQTIEIMNQLISNE